MARRTPTTPTAIVPPSPPPYPFFSTHSRGESIESPSKDETLKKDGRPGGSRRRKGDEDSREAAVAATAVAAVAVVAAAVRMTHVERGGKRDMPATYNAGDSSRTPQALSHLFCSWRFVGFLPHDGKTTVVRLGVARLVSSRLVSRRLSLVSH